MNYLVTINTNHPNAYGLLYDALRGLAEQLDVEGEYESSILVSDTATHEDLFGWDLEAQQ